MARKTNRGTKSFGTWLLENAVTLPEDYELDPSDKVHQPQLIANLAEIATRKRLTPAALKAFVRLVDIWQLTAPEARAIAGISAQRTWLRIKNGDWLGTLNQDQLTRLSAIFGIYKGLHILYSDTLADEWIQRANSGKLFRGQRPIDMMIRGGIPAMIDTRRHIDAKCSGN